MYKQKRSSLTGNTKTVAHIKGRLLDQAAILFNFIPFQMELLLKERICSQMDRILSFKSSSLWHGKSLLPYKVTSLEYYFFYCARA